MRPREYKTDLDIVVDPVLGAMLEDSRGRLPL